ncbi:MAG: imidazoleglycerol-phosphate dehydratase HisB [Dehalococcoidia bacterium]|nr:imidazoleglycerol-phosphate dehydratase HisB [Dehalococcoidia bacterium]RLC64771.1 MAG: imidazoleglycerol-phosphate dehydratase HisB [Chloroflexota bacterium]
MTERKAKVIRETAETNVKVELNIDGSGQFQITTGVRMFDHFLSQLAQHGVFDVKISASGSDQHHVVEDVAISLGKAFNQALGKKQGIVRMAHAIVPMDEALAAVAVDIGGRIYNVIEGDFDEASIGDMDADLVRHFLISFASEARINLHARVFCGINDHHKAEALFKALGRALDSATRIDERLIGRIPSTKEVIEG